MSPRRPLPDERTRMRNIYGQDWDGAHPDEPDGRMSGSDTENSESDQNYSVFEGSGAESDDNMSLTSIE